MVHILRYQNGTTATRTFRTFKIHYSSLEQSAFLTTQYMNGSGVHTLASSRTSQSNRFIVWALLVRFLFLVAAQNSIRQVRTVASHGIIIKGNFRGRAKHSRNLTFVPISICAKRVNKQRFPIEINFSTVSVDSNIFGFPSQIHTVAYLSSSMFHVTENIPLWHSQ